MFPQWENKLSKNLNPAFSMENEADLVKDKCSTENIYFDSCQFGDYYEYKENVKVCVRGQLKASIQYWKLHIILYHR